MNGLTSNQVTLRSRLFVVGLMTSLLLGLPAHAAFCVVPDAGGTAGLPPVGCEYTTPDDDLYIIDGLPVGTNIQIDAVLHSFINIVAGPGGTLAGQQQTYDASLSMPMVGNGALAGYNRNIIVSVANESHSAPRTPGTTPQAFVTDMYQMFGQVFGDPDFDLLRITAGTNFGLPSPGHTTLTRLGPPGSDWNVDSFFDITYRIDFVGSPGSVLQGMSGSTTGTARFVAGMAIPEPGTMTLALLGSLAFIRRHRLRQEAAVGGADTENRGEN